jgi:hypothetical protein
MSGSGILRSLDILVLVASSVSISHSQRVQEDTTLANAWTVYQRAPSDETALKLYQALPSNADIALKVHRGQRKTLRSIYNHLKVLDDRVLNGDRNAVKVAFRLYAVSDGDFGETLDIELGRLIKINPRLFLQELKVHRALVERIDALLGNCGDEYIDRMDAKARELRARVKALKTINDTDLQGIRDECISVLNQECTSLTGK